MMEEAMEEMKRANEIPFCPIAGTHCLQEACALYDPLDKECSILGINNTLKEIVRTRVVK